MDPKEVTKQMLFKCKVLRKRNSNVTPLKSQPGRSLILGKSPRTSPKNMSKYIPAQVHQQPSLNDYLDTRSFEKASITAREITITTPPKVSINLVH